MAEKEKRQAEDQARAREELERLLAALAPPETGDSAPPSQAGQIISPVDIQRLLRIFRDIPLDISQEGIEKIDPLRRELNTVINILQKISNELVARQLEDGLSWIYHPIYGDSVAAARIRQLIHMLATSIRRMWYFIADNFDKMSTAELAEALETAELSTKLSFLVITDTWAKIMTLFFTNAPPSARPPLVNAALGYEIVGSYGEIGGRRVRAPSLLERLTGRRKKEKK